MNKVQINGYLLRLIETNGHDEEARNGLASIIDEIPRAGISFEYIHSTPPASKTIIKGETGHGTVSIEDNNDHPRVKKYSMGENSLRIGDFTIQVVAYGREKKIIFTRDTEANIGANADIQGNARHWALAVGKDGNPTWFGERGATTHCVRFPFTQRIFAQAQRYKYVEGWPQEGRTHNAGINIVLR